MNDKYSTTEGKTSEKLSDEAMLSAQWKNIDWHKAEREVNRLQIRIVKATQQKDYNAVKRLQYLLTHSFYAKALAVKRVVTQRWAQDSRCGWCSLEHPGEENESGSIADR